jgi:hypothetical protein
MPTGPPDAEPEDDPEEEPMPPGDDPEEDPDDGPEEDPPDDVLPEVEPEDDPEDDGPDDDPEEEEEDPDEEPDPLVPPPSSPIENWPEGPLPQAAMAGATASAAAHAINDILPIGIPPCRTRDSARRARLTQTPASFGVPDPRSGQAPRRSPAVCLC